jgi:SAM-dependent methyltransferase
MTSDIHTAARFYDQYYSSTHAEGELFAGWRRLGAEHKAANVLDLAARTRAASDRVIEIGCGDGAIISALRTPWARTEFLGVDISRVAIELAREKGIPGADFQTFDGDTLPTADRFYDIAILSHVLEHAPDPEALLREAGRVSDMVIVEVPLEANLMARLPAARAEAKEIGHIFSFDQSGLDSLVGRAGLRLLAKQIDPLTPAHFNYWSNTQRRRQVELAKFNVRTALLRRAPRLATRLFTYHYAVACDPS